MQATAPGSGIFPRPRTRIDVLAGCAADVATDIDKDHADEAAEMWEKFLTGLDNANV